MICKPGRCHTRTRRADNTSAVGRHTTRPAESSEMRFLSGLKSGPILPGRSFTMKRRMLSRKIFLRRLPQIASTTTLRHHELADSTRQRRKLSFQCWLGCRFGDANSLTIAARNSTFAHSLAALRSTRGQSG